MNNTRQKHVTTKKTTEACKDTLSLRNDHPILTSCHDVAQICKPLERLGINYFSYTRTYKNGERVYLSTQARILENFFAKKHYLTCGNESHPDHYKGQIVLWSAFSQQRCYAEAAEMDVAHGMYLFDPSKEYCESYAFATSNDNHRIVSTYFNNIELLKKFSYYVKEKASSILQNIEKNRIILPVNDTYKELIKYESKNFDDILSINWCSDKFKLSKRQIECAKLIIQGNSAKEISIILNLSQRTVEYYSNLLKIKLHCRNKTELVLKLKDIFNN